MFNIVIFNMFNYIYNYINMFNISISYIFTFNKLCPPEYQQYFIH